MLIVRRFVALAGAILALALADARAAEPRAMAGGFDYAAEASQWFNDGENVASGLMRWRLERQCNGWQSNFSLDISMTNLDGTLRVAGSGVQVENLAGTEGAAQLAMQYAGDPSRSPGTGFSYGARWRRSAADGAGDGKLNHVTASGETIHAIDLRAQELTPVRAWWAMIEALHAGAPSFVQDLTLFGPTISTEFGTMARQKAFFGVIDPAFETMPLPADPDGAWAGRNWTVNVTLPDDELAFDGVRISVLQLFESGAPGYIMLKRPDTRILLRPTSVALLPAPDC